MSKYNSKKTVVDGQKFDSKKEANRYSKPLSGTCTAGKGGSE